MQLQPPVKREPFRPPPRTPEQIAEDHADDTAESFEEVAELVEDERPPDASVSNGLESPPAPTTEKSPAEEIGPPPASERPGDEDAFSRESTDADDGFGEGIPADPPPGP